MFQFSTKQKLKFAAKGIGLSDKHISTADQFISRLRQNELVDLFVPEHVQTTADVYDFVTTNSDSLADVLPPGAVSAAANLLTDQRARTAVARMAWRAAQKLNPEELQTLREAMDAIADFGLLGKTDFEDEVEFISEGALPFLVSYMPSTETRPLDTHADIVCKCPKCETVFIPPK